MAMTVIELIDILAEYEDDTPVGVVIGENGNEHGIEAVILDEADYHVLIVTE